MPSSTDAIATSIGDCLCALREERGLTLEQMAELSGLSKSHLSRLESSERQPSVTSLLALAAALGVPIGSLFGEAPAATPLSVSEANEPRHESNGLAIAPCGGYSGSSVIDALRISVPPGRPAPVPARHFGEEWLYVVSGTLTLEYDGQPHLLREGMTAHFNAEVPHRLAAMSPTEVLLVASKPVRYLHQIH
jgi:transcriptional regulator with XRE-family HTH domain